MADTPVEVDVNTDNLNDFEQLFLGKATAKPAEDAPLDPNEVIDPVEDADANEPTEDANPDPDEEPTGDEPVEAEDDDKPDDDAAEEDILKPRKKSVQERIDEVVAEKHAERRAREAAEREAEELRRQLREKTEPKPTSAPGQVAVNPDDPAPDPDALDEHGRAVYPLGEFDPRYIADITKHTIRQETALARAEAERDRALQTANDARTNLTKEWNVKLDKSSEKIPDLKEALAKMEPRLANIEPSLGVYLAETIMGMENGPEVLYYLANHPDETDQIVSVGATRATLQLGRLEAKIQSALAKRETPTARVTAAPVPVATVPRGNGGVRTATRADTENLDEFERLFYTKK